MREPGSIFSEIVFADDGIGTFPPTAGASIIQLAAVTQEGLSADQSPEPRAETFPLSYDPVQLRNLGYRYHGLQKGDLPWMAGQPKECKGGQSQCPSPL